MQASTAKVFCAQVCEITLCSQEDLQQSLVDSCYETCACETQGLSLGSTYYTSGTLQPSIAFCYTQAGRPPSDGSYFTQADIAAYDEIFNLPPNTCPVGVTIITGANGNNSTPVNPVSVQSLMSRQFQSNATPPSAILALFMLIALKIATTTVARAGTP